MKSSIPVALLLFVGFGQSALADQSSWFVAEGVKVNQIAVEYATEKNVSQGIRTRDIRLVFEEYYRDRFSAAIEVAAKDFDGNRDSVSNDTLAVSLGFLVKWNFFASTNLSVFNEIGFAALASKEPFPHRGTKVNGLSTVGLGLTFGLPNRRIGMIGIRLHHSSNGKGIVENNPAYDSSSVYVGIGF